MKLVLFGGFVLLSGVIMFSVGSIDGTGNSYINWIISLQNIGAIVMIIGFILSLIGLIKKSDDSA